MQVTKLSEMLAFAGGHLRRPQVLAGLLSLAVGAGIATNALFLQAGPHPSPFFFTRERQSQHVGQQPDELVRDVQGALLQVGYYSGPLDGIAGPQTRSAIEAFETQAGHAPSGEANLELLAEIREARRPDLSPVSTRVSGPAEQAMLAPTSPATAPQTAQADPLVASVQDALARSAYGPLTADGVAGPDTREAILRFQRDHNLPATGEVSDALVVELRAAGALGGQ